MNGLTVKYDRAFPDGCEAPRLEPGATVESLKERFVATDFLSNPLVWLQAELPYCTYGTRGAGQDAANRI